MSLIWGAIFTLAALQFRFLTRSVLVWGGLFGVFAKLVMAHVIVPLGHARMPAGMPFHYVLNKYAAHIVFFGIPVAWIVSRAFSSASAVAPTAK